MRQPVAVSLSEPIHPDILEFRTHFRPTYVVLECDITFNPGYLQDLLVDAIKHLDGHFVRPFRAQRTELLNVTMASAKVRRFYEMLPMKYLGN